MEKSIKERANEYNPLLDGDDDDKRICNYDFEDLMYAYFDGATEQKAIDIEKACEAYCKACPLSNPLLKPCGGCANKRIFERHLKALEE